MEIETSLGIVTEHTARMMRADGCALFLLAGNQLQLKSKTGELPTQNLPMLTGLHQWHEGDYQFLAVPLNADDGFNMGSLLVARKTNVLIKNPHTTSVRPITLGQTVISERPTTSINSEFSKAEGEQLKLLAGFASALINQHEQERSHAKRESQWRDLAENAPGLFWLDANATIKFAGRTARASGFMLAQNARNVLEDWPGWSQLLDKVLNNEHVQAHNPNPDAQQQVELSPLPDGGAIGVLLHSPPVASSLMFERLPFGVVISTLTGEPVLMNKFARQVVGKAKLFENLNTNIGSHNNLGTPAEWPQLLELCTNARQQYSTARIGQNGKAYDATVMLLPDEPDKLLHFINLPETGNESEGGLRGRMDERLQLARELHDGVGKDLYGLSMLLDGAARRAKKLGNSQNTNSLDAAKLAEELSELAKISRDLATQSRALISDMRQRETSLLDELREMIAKSERESGLHFKLEHDEPLPKITPERRHELLRIAQEAIRNATSHARATQILVRLVRGQHGLKLEVEDDGQGLPTVLPEGHYGLAGMRERAEQLGGSLSVSSQHGGTRIVVELPAA